MAYLQDDCTAMAPRCTAIISLCLLAHAAATRPLDGMLHDNVAFDSLQLDAGELHHVSQLQSAGCCDVLVASLAPANKAPGFVR